MSFRPKGEIPKTGLLSTALPGNLGPDDEFYPATIIIIVVLYDYYIWGYDYGHNLNPHAAIKVPGMSYQPPLIGSKKLLNFTSTSWPAAGGIVIGISILLSISKIIL